MRRASALSIALVFCAAFAAAQNREVDVLHYRIEVDVPPAGDEIAARAELTVRPLAPLPRSSSTSPE